MLQPDLPSGQLAVSIKHGQVTVDLLIKDDDFP